MTIRLDETEIRGHWTSHAGKVEADQTCRRIEQLIASCLREVSRDVSGWDVLYSDPSDGRYWELIYPESHLHGGGPPTLKHLTKATARKKYGVL
jgi:hypothetical protein